MCNVIVCYDFVEVIWMINCLFEQDEVMLEEEFEEIVMGCEVICKEILVVLQLRMFDFGIEIFDVQFCCINYGDDCIKEVVYKCMILEC